jgi:hypothetical protein
MRDGDKRCRVYDIPSTAYLPHPGSAWSWPRCSWSCSVLVALPLPGGIELLVLDGSFIEGGEEFTWLSWLRLPAGARLQATAGLSGCEVWVKSGHLAREP